MVMDFDDMLQNTMYDDSCLDDTNGGMFLTNGIITPDEYNSQISFGGQIDDLYDPSINSAQDDLIHHLEEATNARTTDDLEYHLDKAEEARISEDYWKDAKRSAEIEAEKRDIFIDGINKQWEIMDRYQSEMEDMSKRK